MPYSYTLIHIDVTEPTSKLERLWATILLPLAIAKFVWTGKFAFLRKEAE